MDFIIYKAIEYLNKNGYSIEEEDDYHLTIKIENSLRKLNEKQHTYDVLKYRIEHNIFAHEDDIKRYNNIKKLW